MSACKRCGATKLTERNCPVCNWPGAVNVTSNNVHFDVAPSTLKNRLPAEGSEEK